MITSRDGVQFRKNPQAYPEPKIEDITSIRKVISERDKEIEELEKIRDNADAVIRNGYPFETFLFKALSGYYSERLNKEEYAKWYRSIKEISRQ